MEPNNKVVSARKCKIYHLFVKTFPTVLSFCILTAHACFCGTLFGGFLGSNSKKAVNNGKSIS